MKNFVLLIAAVAGFSFGLYFYSRGFLLTRHATGKTNACSDVRINVRDDDTSVRSSISNSTCWVKARFRRSIWVIIDALRYDFITPISDNVNEYYHNKLTVATELLSTRPRNSLLYRFIADAPTTTLQRLKGLTTGSLPTFIDAGQNFGGVAIDEDNLIDQLVRRGKNITFLGDDTWTALFPSQFSRSFPFLSFDVKDLHTVDNGILEHLFSEIALDGWDVLIAHFLGVDHCGHKYGPNHPEMTAKLGQMNDILRRIIDTMDSDTVLFVLGDHGMTQSGDHGGDSGDEINAALFVYSPTELHEEETNIRGSVNQIDFVPTVALLMDVPIPFSSLGRLLPELFPDHRLQSRAVEANILQVFRFTEMYMANFRDQLLIDQLQPVFRTFYAQEPGELTTEKSLACISRIYGAFVESWAKFHIGWMALGIVTLLENFLWLVSVLISRPGPGLGRRLILKVALFALSLWVVLDRQESIPPMVGILCGLLIIVHVHTIVWSFLWHGGTVFSDDHSSAFSSLIAGFILVAHGLAQFSNSFVVYEDTMAFYFSASLLVIVLLTNTTRRTKTTTSRQSTGEKRRRQTSKFLQQLDSSIGCKSIIYCVVGLIMLRSVAFFGRCREEQHPCTSSIFTAPFASLLDENSKMVRILVALISLFLLYQLPHQFLARNGHLNGDSIFCVILGFAHTAMTVLITGYWTLQWLPESSIAAVTGSTQVLLFPPLLCYGLLLLLLLAYLECPHLTSTHSIQGDPATGMVPPVIGINANGALSDSEAVQHAYKYLKTNWKQYLNYSRGQPNPRLAAFGVASGYSASLISIYSSIAYLLALVLGDKSSFPLFAFTLVAVILMELDSEKGSLLFVALLSELSTHFFYSFGHQPTFATIPWEAAFVGIPGNFRYRWVQGTMVILHIAASQVLVVFVIPLKACWRYYGKKLGPFALQRASTIGGSDSDGLRTEVEIIQRGDTFLDEITHLNCSYLAATAVKVLCSTLASALHRRHLMVWKIFAPKFIFDGVTFLVTCAALIVQYCLVVRLHKSMQGRFSHVEFIHHRKVE